MNIALWVITALLAGAFLAAGVMKVAQPKSALADKGMGWVEDFSPGQVKAIGTLEIIGALGVLLLAGIAPAVVPFAALGLGLIMVGAIVTHVRRGEYANVAVNAALLALAAVVVWGRLGPYAF